jgi:hypothetical protein
MTHPKGYFVILALAIAIGCGVWWQAKANVRLREEQACFTEQAVELARIKALMARHQAAAVSAGELKKLNEAAAEASSLRDRIEKLTETKSPSVPGAPQAPKQSEERWRNLGQATPGDTVRSIIWAATGGEVDALVSMLTYDADSRVAADDLFASIPPESRALFPSADRLVATMIAGRLPTDLAEARVIEQTDDRDGAVQAKVRLSSSTKYNDTPREVAFSFQRTGSAWQLVVPKSVILEFKRALGTR